jgi:hypothetical protein
MSYYGAARTSGVSRGVVSRHYPGESNVKGYFVTLGIGRGIWKSCQLFKETVFVSDTRLRADAQPVFMWSSTLCEVQRV